MLSETDCKTILENYLRSSDFKLINHECESFSTEAEGFMGDHYRLIIHYEFKGTLTKAQFFLKTTPKNQSQNDIAQKFGLYKREIFAYNTLMKEFEKYGFDIDFASASYHYIGDTALVLEDLTLSGYSITERHEAFSLAHCRCALDALAAYHAAGYAYQWTKTMEGGAHATTTNSFTRQYRLDQQYPVDLKEPFYVQFIDTEAYAMNSWKGSRATILKLCEILRDNPRFANFETHYNNYQFGKAFVTNHGINKTCGHGDLWSNNLMFKYENKEPIKCRLLDFQFTRYFYPCLDVILVIFCNTNKEFRKKHLQDLYRHYFDSFSNILRIYNCPVEEIHPWEHFLHSIDIVMPDALAQVTLVNFVVSLPAKKITNIIKKEDDEINDLVFNNSEMVAEAFQTDEVYRNKLLELLGEFYDVLPKE